jgi:hypothetical protein
MRKLFLALIIAGIFSSMPMQSIQVTVNRVDVGY